MHKILAINVSRRTGACRAKVEVSACDVSRKIGSKMRHLVTIRELGNGRFDAYENKAQRC